MNELRDATVRQGIFRCPGCSEMVFATFEVRSELQGTSIMNNELKLRLGGNCRSMEIHHVCKVKLTEQS